LRIICRDISWYRRVVVALGLAVLAARPSRPAQNPAGEPKRREPEHSFGHDAPAACRRLASEQLPIRVDLLRCTLLMT
jgi:hypothetical protein